MRWKLGVVCLLSIFAASSYAQFKASLQGTVMDPGQAAIANAKVTITDQATGISREATTNDQGFYPH